LIVSGLMYIFAAASGKDPSGAKKWIIWALIGLVLVACSYFIIRLIQYLAKGV
jgi:FtsH-binding integral membrane protein